MNNTKPETTVAPSKQPEVSNVPVKDVAANQSNAPIDQDKQTSAETKQAAPTTEVSKR